MYSFFSFFCPKKKSNFSVSFFKILDFVGLAREKNGVPLNVWLCFHRLFCLTNQNFPHQFIFECLFSFHLEYSFDALWNSQLKCENQMTHHHHMGIKQDYIYINQKHHTTIGLVWSDSSVCVFVCGFSQFVFLVPSVSYVFTVEFCKPKKFSLKSIMWHVIFLVK